MLVVENHYSTSEKPETRKQMQEHISSLFETHGLYFASFVDERLQKPELVTIGRVNCWLS